MSTKVLVGHESPLLLDALATSLSSVDGFSVVGVAGLRDDVLPSVLRTSPDVTVLGAPGGGEAGVGLARDVRRQSPRSAVVVVAACPTRSLVDEAVRAGALSVVPMDMRLPQLVRTIRGAAVGCLSVQPRAARPTPRRTGALSDRERDVLRLTWAGASMKEIARDLCLACGTVRNNASSAIRKLEGRNRFDAARIAQESGWL